MTLSRLVRGLFLLLFCQLSLPAFAASGKNWNQIGDSAYAHKLYDSALVCYEEAARLDKGSAVLQYKLANTHYRLGHTGEAVLSYQKALRLQPGFSEAAENVRIIQKSLLPASENQEVFFVRWWSELTRSDYGNTWAFLALIFFCVPVLLLIWSRWRRVNFPWLWPQGTLSGISLSILFAVLSISSLSKPELGTGVVMRPAAPFNPGSKSGTVSLPEGLLVRVLREEKGGLLVSLGDGRKGIIQPTDIAIVK